MYSDKLERSAAFTLIELSVVILILSLLAAASMRYASTMMTTSAVNATNANLDVVEAALYNFRMQWGRLPCPSDITMAESMTSFGTEIDSNGDGQCTSANFVNSGADPDSASLYYDSTSSNQPADPANAPNDLTSGAGSHVVGGGVPTKALLLADKYAYDSWGRKILYVVDKRFTRGTTPTSSTYTPAFNYYTPTASVTLNGTTNPIGYVVIKRLSTDSLANAITYSAVYALVSMGPNGHGGYVRVIQPSAAIAGCNTGTGVNCSIPYNANSSNTDELKNCHCDGSATATAFDRIFIQNTNNIANQGANNTPYDDIVRAKKRPDIDTSSENQ
jgi:prepilin-type N-terminal cleavage/methylation domain-containing protein